MNNTLTDSQKNAVKNAYWSLFDGYDASLELNGGDNIVTREIRESLQELESEFPWLNPEPINVN